MVSNYDPAELHKKVEQLVKIAPEKAWIHELLSVIDKNIAAFPPLADAEQRFVTDFFYPH